MPAFSIFAIPSTLSSDDRMTRRHMLARVGLAWLAMMQVMMFAFPGYVRGQPMPEADLTFLDTAIIVMNWISLALTVPVVWYCASPVWKGALRRLRQVKISMDIPVALGIVAAFIPSVWATWTTQGDVYFDSVTMFVAFLLTARYLELCARQSVSGGALHHVIEQQRGVLSGRSDKVAAWFTIAQVALALAAGLFWWNHDPSQAIPVMVALLVISCPCAMAMAVPTAVAAAHASLAVGARVTESDLNRLKQATGNTAKQSLYGAMLWHLILTPLAAAGWVRPWLAAITMLVSSLAVAANAWLLFRRQRREFSELPLAAAAS